MRVCRVSERLLVQTATIRSCHLLCCFLSDTRLRREVDVGGRQGGNEITICLSDVVHLTVDQICFQAVH